MSGPHVDIAIIGAGAAGLELARLASGAGLNVVLFEQGTANGRHIFQRIPLMVGKIIGNKRFVDATESMPQTAAGNRKLPMLAGRGLGGSSRVNGNVAYAGPPQRYKIVFNSLGLNFDPVLAELAKDPYRTHSWNDALTLQFLKATGNQVHDPDNSRDFLGASILHVNTKRGLRHNHLENYRKNAVHNHIRVVRSTAHKLVFDGLRAVGVQTRDDVILANEIVLSAGAIGSPALLMKSGIGAAKMLESASINVQLDQPQIGKHLKDHANLRLAFSCPGYDTLNQKTRGLRAVWEGLKYLSGNKNSILRGPGASAGVNIAAGDNGMQDAFRIQLVHFTQDRASVGDKGIVFERQQKASLGLYPLWPKSTGEIRISAQGLQINPGFLTDPSDVKISLLAMEHARNLMADMGFKADPVSKPDKEILRQGVYSGYHLIGSNRMSQDAQTGVVGPDFKVHGLTNLSVCDASVMPDHLSSHSYLPTIAMARMFGQMRGWG